MITSNKWQRIQSKVSSTPKTTWLCHLGRHSFWDRLKSSDSNTSHLRGFVEGSHKQTCFSSYKKLARVGCLSCMQCRGPDLLSSWALRKLTKLFRLFKVGIPSWSPASQSVFTERGLTEAGVMVATANSTFLLSRLHTGSHRGFVTSVLQHMHSEKHRGSSQASHAPALPTVSSGPCCPTQRQLSTNSQYSVDNALRKNHWQGRKHVVQSLNLQDLLAFSNWRNLEEYNEKRNSLSFYMLSVRGWVYFLYCF